MKDSLEVKSLKKTYYNMMYRCYNTKDKKYNFYGGKGVGVCDEWKNDKQKFIDWSLMNGFKIGLQIDKDIKGNGLLYSPDSCLWVTREINNKYRANINTNAKTIRLKRSVINGSGQTTKILTISKQNPIVRIPVDFLNKIEPDKRVKRIKLSFSVADNKLIIEKLSK